MRWDRFFEDLEGQLDSEWEAERAALDSEAERLRISRLGLRERLQTLAADSGSTVTVDLADGAVLTGTVTAVGADWAALQSSDGRTTVVALDAAVGIGMPEAELLRSARADAPGPRRLAERMTLGFVLRNLARRRVPVTLHLRVGRSLVGTIDRALADHLDVALHDVDAPRRSGSIQGVRMVPLSALAWVRIEARDVGV
ncbi:hypothetical protein PU630_11420 [Microbacterium horticulturae]|uniref:Fis family transcriptional regulator n=1 Tax=Microbacterium horticulturae TaxID=3028316 RepID=A0ABY8BUK0_9MICO|nr:hypothetical protein [Microbacterium sp. KACC 23027]WEG07851.1 hypothetical protein PU630_11420 [Microbacterium sp. KACC 23027]